MPLALIFAAAATLSPLFTDLGPVGVAVAPARPAALTVRSGNQVVTARLTSVAVPDCAGAPWLYGVAVGPGQSCTRVSGISVTVGGGVVIVPVQAYAALGNIARAALQPTRAGADLYMRGGEGGAEDYGVTFRFDRHGLVERRVYWPDGTAETTTFTPAG